MTPKLSSFAELVATANDQFMDENKLVDVLMGIIDKALRAQGMTADAITLDAVELNKKIVFLLPDNSNSVEVALGNKAGDIFEKQHYELAKLSVDELVSLMKSYFLSE
jgi:hypothetical protein